jgi:hypothetical protein
MDVEAGIERLFGLAPEEFVAARDELARRLRKDGDGAAAKRVAGLRRPTVAAWAVNRAARRRPELVTDLIEAGERLRQAQRRALSGLRGGALRTAGAERRVAIERLLAEAADVLEESGRSPEAHRDAIAATLQAASVDETAAAAVRAGTLDREVAAPSGFGEVAGLQLVQPAAAEPEAPERPARPARRRVKLDPARRRELEAARRQRDQRRREARAAAKTAGKAREAADQAAEAEAETTEAARRLAGEATQARRAAEEARRAAEEARRVADEAREAADTARTRSQRAARRARDAAEEAVDAETAAETAQQALGQAERRVTELESGD